MVCVHFTASLLVTDIDHDVTLSGNNVIKGTGMSSRGSISIWLSEAFLKMITPGHGRKEDRVTDQKTGQYTWTLYVVLYFWQYPESPQ